MIPTEAEPEAPLESVAVTVTVYVPGETYGCWTLVTFPGYGVTVPSPKSTVTDVIVLPVVGVALMVNVVVVPRVGLSGDAEMVTASCGFGPTVTEAVDVDVSPMPSTPVATTR